MTLPYVADPHVLTADDIIPCEAAQRVVDLCNDARELFSVQHFNTGRKVAEHNAPQIHVAMLHLTITDNFDDPIVKEVVSKVGIGPSVWGTVSPTSGTLIYFERTQARNARVRFTAPRAFVRYVHATLYPDSIAPKVIPLEAFTSGHTIDRCDGFYIAFQEDIRGLIESVIVLSHGFNIPG